VRTHSPRSLRRRAPTPAITIRAAIATGPTTTATCATRTGVWTTRPRCTDDRLVSIRSEALRTPARRIRRTVWRRAPRAGADGASRVARDALRRAAHGWPLCHEAIAQAVRLPDEGRSTGVVQAAQGGADFHP